MPTVTDRQRNTEEADGDNGQTAEEPRATGDKVGEGAGTITERLRRADGHEERPVETAGTEATPAESGINADRVADMTIEEAEQFVEDNPTLRGTVVELERAGKNRKGIIALAPDDTDGGDAGNDDDADGEGDGE